MAEDKPKTDRAAPVEKNVKRGGLSALLIGMMLSGGGAALSVLQNPKLGLGIAVAGGVLCWLGAWRLIVTRAGG